MPRHHILTERQRNALLARPTWANYFTLGQVSPACEGLLVGHGVGSSLDSGGPGPEWLGRSGTVSMDCRCVADTEGE